MKTNIFNPNKSQVRIFFLFVIFFLSESFKKTLVESTPIQNTTPSAVEKTVTHQKDTKKNSVHSLQEDQKLLPVSQKNFEDLGLVEVNPDSLPEGTDIYVLEESEDQKKNQNDDEIMETASNIVFRPLFRYRSKQQALRRISPGIRRRYFVPKRYYRQVYYPYFYRHRFYYY